jgi:hypothetical protein
MARTEFLGSLMDCDLCCAPAADSRIFVPASRLVFTNTLGFTWTYNALFAHVLRATRGEGAQR